MKSLFRICLLSAAAALTACAHISHTGAVAQTRGACADKASQIIAGNEAAIAEHHYGRASRAAESAAGVSLSCGDRWRAANALVVAAELAHQANELARAHRLLAQGYALMHTVHLRHATALTAALLSQRLDTARRDMRGQWAYW